LKYFGVSRGGLDNLSSYQQKIYRHKCEGGPPMGRGRSKAKQTKVARDLKYSNQDMDLERLAKELHGEAPEKKGNQDNDSYPDEDYK
jgi:hypothetical protein